MTGGLCRAALSGLAVLIVTVLAVIAAAEAMESWHGHGRSLERPVDAAIVLGAGVYRDGTLEPPSRRRVAAAVELLRKGMARALIVSGGPVPQVEPTAAELMRDYAISLGAPRESVLVEDAAGSTFENLRFSFEIARQAGLDRLAIVTDDSHLLRAAWLACYFGDCGIGMVAAPASTEWSEFLREALAWWYNIGKVAVWSLLGAAGIPEETRGHIVE